MLKIADLNNAPEVENPFPFPLDPFQKHAFAAIDSHENVFVTAKTGSGKTLVGEYQIKVSISRGKRVFYTTPVKSLTNQKFNDLKKLGLSVGIMTGDIKFCPDADVVVMTTEILCNLLYSKNTQAGTLGDAAALSIKNLDAVIFDEVHYINNMERGKVWEECLILMPPEIKLVLLSATIDQPEKLGQWLGDLKQRPVRLISTMYRIVPLVHQAGKEVLMDAKDVFYPDAYNRWLRSLDNNKKDAATHRGMVADRRRDGYANGPIAKGVRNHSFSHRMNELVREMDKEERLPALFFVFSRKNCEAYARRIEDTMLDSSDIASVKHIVSFHLHRYPEVLMSPQYFMLMERLEKGVAFHHSGLLPILREIVEILYGRGFIKLLFATETFAVGINMPTKTVVVTSFKKHDEKGLRMLKKDEYIQMAGRAGRRGKDDRGDVIYIPEREPESLADVKTMMTSGQQRIVSKMDFHYKFILRAHYGFQMDWRDIASKSFWKAQNDELIRGAEIDYERLTKQQESLGLSDILGDMQMRESLEQKIKITGNAERRDAQKALEAWKNTHVGPKWETAWDSYKLWTSMSLELISTKNSIDFMRAYEGEIKLREDWLYRHRFIGTEMGHMASLVHTGHPLLMARAYKERIFHDLNTVEFMGCLALFLDDGRKEGILLNNCKLSPEALSKANQLVAIAKEYRDADIEDEFWTVGCYWVDIVVRWTQGDYAFKICQDYNIYEGDFVKAILKLSKLVEEWLAMATLTSDVPQLEARTKLDLPIVRGIVIPESLYIRLQGSI